MATYTPKRLVGPLALTTSLVDTYSPTGTAVIKQIIFNNTSNASVTVFAHIGTGTAPTGIVGAIITQLTVGPYSQVIWSADIPLLSSDHLWIKAGTGSVVNVTVSGIEIS